MANKPLKSIKFPNLSDIYTVPSVDNTLSQTGQAADAKKTGDEIAQLKDDITHIGVSDNIKVALLDCFRNVAWINDQGQTYYDVLEDALYGDTYPRITATYNPGVNVVYTDDALDTLKQYLTVKYYATQESTGTVVASNDYTLSGVLTEGTSIVEITYENLHTRVNIPGVVDFYNQHTFLYPSSELGARIGNSGINSTTQKLGTNPNIKHRKIVFAKKGIVSYYDTISGENIDVYPIPVPGDATSITVSYDVNTIWCAVNIFLYNGSNYSLFQDLGSFGYNGGDTKDLPDGENRFATLIFGQPNNATFEGTDLPESVTITFN